MLSKANLLKPGCGKEKYSIYLQGTKQGEQAASAQKTQTPQWLSGKGFLFFIFSPYLWLIFFTS